MGSYTAQHPKRTFAAALGVIRTARAMLLERGNVTAVKDLLRANRLSVLHTKLWNPFLLLPHVDFDCFPQDHLHGV